MRNLQLSETDCRRIFTSHWLLTIRLYSGRYRRTIRVSPQWVTGNQDEDGQRAKERDRNTWSLQITVANMTEGKVSAVSSNQGYAHNSSLSSKLVDQATITLEKSGSRYAFIKKSIFKNMERFTARSAHLPKNYFIFSSSPFYYCFIPPNEKYS